MKTKKLSLANIQGRLSRAEMKNIMGGGSGSGNNCCCAHYNDGNFDRYSCGKTEADAKAKADDYAQQYGNGHWCCDSCQISNPCIA